MEKIGYTSVSHDEYMGKELDQLPLPRGTEHPTGQDISSVVETAALKDVEMNVGTTRAGRRGRPASNKTKVKTGRKVKQQKQGQRDEALQASSDTVGCNAGSRVHEPKENRVLEDKDQGPQEIVREKRTATVQPPECEEGGSRANLLRGGADVIT